MKIRKKILSIILCTAMVLCFSSCGQNSNAVKETSSAPSAEANNTVSGTAGTETVSTDTASNEASSTDTSSTNAASTDTASKNASAQTDSQPSADDSKESGPEEGAGDSKQKADGTGNEAADPEQEANGTGQESADPDHKADSSEQDEEFKTIVSSKSNFSIECDSSYEYAEEENGQLNVFLVSEEDYYPLLSVLRYTNGKSAWQILEEDAESIRESLGDAIQVDPGQPELTEFDDRDFYTSYAEVSINDMRIDMLEYAEEFEDGTVLCYGIAYQPEYKEEATAAIEKAMLSAWVGELDESVSDGSDEETADAQKKTTSGRWSFTQKVLENGNIEFVIDDVLIMEVPGSWKDKASWSVDGDFFTFYHKASYDKMMKEGMKGGALFSIVFYPDESYQNLPSYDYIGLADGGHYVMAFPTDVQGYMNDEDVWAEWQVMYDEVEYIREHVYSTIFS